MKQLKERSQNSERINIEMKDLFSRYATDVIASCAFGLKVSSFDDPENEFLESGKKMMDFTGFRQILKIFFINKFPFVLHALNIKFSDREATKFFKSLILDTMETRKRENIHRPDMINIMMHIREQSKKKDVNGNEESNDENVVTSHIWSEDEIVAQCFLFFVAGLEPVSTMLTFLVYELVANPDIQQKLYDEIYETNERLEGKHIDYETLQKLEYLDQVVSECLRKWPPTPQVDRVCNKTFVFHFNNGMKFNVEKDIKFVFPIYGVHHDPMYFPEPEKFDPERFNEDNKISIKPGTYIPFGLGPRNCIGRKTYLISFCLFAI